MQKINLTSNMEDYMEVILCLSEKNGVVRVGEIAERLEVKSSSVNSALKSLSKEDMIIHEKYGYIKLTDKGKKVAQEVKDKHDILLRFLTEFLMINRKDAEKEACALEHAISEKTFVRLTKFFKFLETGLVNDKPKILKSFEMYLKTGKKLKCDCENHK